jgi:tetratricopeptide (TPR) repeat protein
MISRILAVLSFGAFALAHPGTAAAQGENSAQPSEAAQQPDRIITEAARQHFERGVAHYHDGEFEAALAEFKRAHRIAPNYKLLYNLAQVSQQLRDPVAAQRYFQEYLELGGTEIEPDRKAEVSAELLKLQQRIGVLTLESNAANATFFVDGVAVGAEALRGPVMVRAGTRRISAEAPGRSRVMRGVEIVGGERQEVRLEFPPAHPLGQPSASDGAESSSNTLLILGTGTALLAMSTGVMVILTTRDERAYQAELGRATTRARLDSMAERAKSKALVTDVLLGATLVAGITLLVVGLTDIGSDAEQAPNPGARSAAKLHLGLAALQFEQSF